MVRPQMNLDPVATPWGRSIEQDVEALKHDSERSAQNYSNSNKGQTGTIDTLSRNVADLARRVTDAIDNITLDASKTVSGTFDLARIPTIPQTQVSGTWDKSVETTGAGKFAFTTQPSAPMPP